MHTGNVADIAPRAPARGTAAAPPAQRTPDLSQLQLTGISNVAGKRMANINANIFAAGDEATVKIAGRALAVKCVEVREQSVVLSAGGATREIFVEGVRPPASALAEGTPLWMFGSETES